LKHIPHPVKIFVVGNPSQDSRIQLFLTAVRHLLKSYTEAFETEGKSFRVTYLDPFRDRKILDTLVERYKLNEENAVVVVYESRFTILSMNDFYTTDTPPKFQGENTLTRAILNLGQDKPKVVYWLTGHGETDPQNVHPQNGASLAFQLLFQNNIQVCSLPYATALPDNVDLVIICGPQTRFLPKEVNEIKHYLGHRNGRVMAFLPPVYEHGLEDLLQDWGIRAEDSLVVDNGPDLLSGGGDLLIRRLKPHPITHLLIQNKLGIVFGFIRPVQPDETAPLDKQKSCTPLLYVSDTGWSKKDYASKNFTFDPDYDRRGPFSIATVAERSVHTDVGIQIPGGCLAVFGCSDWVSNAKLPLLGNRWLFLNTVKWCLDQDEALNIPPKPLEMYAVNASRHEFILLTLNFLLLPMGLFFMGTLIFLARRN
jgi:hypothetical protein